MPFAYLRDPLFLTCFFLYWLNRLFLKQIPHPAFFDAYFNDLICIPFLLPILLYAARLSRLRRHDGPPQTHEIFIPLGVWSVLFEIVFPRHPFWSRWLTGDPYDILFYSLGACGASFYWRRRFSDGVKRTGTMWKRDRRWNILEVVLRILHRKASSTRVTFRL